MKDAFNTNVLATFGFKHQIERTGLGQLGRAAVRTLAVFDMIGAKNCGVPGIGVYFGFAEPGELEEAGADYTVETTEELKTLLMKLVTEAEN